MSHKRREPVASGYFLDRLPIDVVLPFSGVTFSYSLFCFKKKNFFFFFLGYMAFSSSTIFAELSFPFSMASTLYVSLPDGVHEIDPGPHILRCSFVFFCYILKKTTFIEKTGVS